MRQLYIYVMVLLISSLFLFSCENFKRRVQEADNDKEQIREEMNEKDEVETPADASALDDIPVNPKIVRPDIVNNIASIDIYKGENQSINIEFPSFGNKKITARITSHDEMANLRFNMIVMPDDETDGPFGRDLSYDLTMDGNYTLVIGEDMMAGEPWSGNFTLDFELTN